MLLLLVSCLGAPQPTTLVMAIPADPGDAVTSPGEIADALSAPLIGAEPGCPTRLIPGVVKAWGSSDDGRVLHWTLSTGYAWSDGAPVTAADLTLAWSRSAKSPEMAAATLVIDDATHARWTFPSPGPAIERQVAAAAVGLLPSHRLKDEDRAIGWRDLPSSGAWQVHRWTPGESVVLRPNPGWPGREPDIHELRFEVMPEPARRLAGLVSRDVDVVDGVPVAAIADIAENHREIALHRRGFQQVMMVVWNTRRPVLADPRVRRALSLAVDTDPLIAAFTGLDGEVYARRAVGTVPPDRCEAYADDIAALHVDPAAARAVLAGLAFELLVPPDDIALGEALVASWRSAGVAAKIVPADDKRLAAGDFDAALAAVSGDPLGPWLGWTGYQSAAVNAASLRATTAPDAGQRAEAWREVQRQIYADQPATFLYWTDDIVAIHRRFGDAHPDSRRVLRDVETWTVGPR